MGKQQEGVKRKIIEIEANKTYACQCVVNTGSYNDPIGKNGISHIIEHFLIHYSRRNKFFENVMIQGFTGFYYTNYYWYVNDMQEAMESFVEFENIFCESVKCLKDEELFEVVKKDIEKEIIFFEQKTDKVSVVVSTLSSKDNEIFLPIGRVDDVRKMEYEDMTDYLDKYYTRSNAHKFLFDKSNKILYFTKRRFESLQIFGTTKFAEKAKISCDAFKEMCIGIQRFKCSLEENSIKLVFKNVFVDTFAEIFIGEIFMMQICDYIKKEMGSNVRVEYEKIYICKDKIYFVLTIHGMNSDDYSSILHKQRIDIHQILQDIIEESGFKRIISYMRDYLFEYDCTKAKMHEIMMDLINYATLSYNSYNIISDKECIIAFVRGFQYEQYCKYVYISALRMCEESLRLLY